MRFQAYYDGEKDLKGNVRGWRVVADYRDVGGQVIDLCGATDEWTARNTAEEMNRSLSR